MTHSFLHSRWCCVSVPLTHFIPDSGKLQGQFPLLHDGTLTLEHPHTREESKQLKCYLYSEGNLILDLYKAGSTQVSSLQGHH